MSEYDYPRFRFLGELWFWALAILLLTVTVIAIVGVVRWLSAPARGKLVAREQIQSGSFRIAAYDHFFNLCAAVQATEGVLAASYSELHTAKGADVERIHTNITGLLAQRARSVAQYNVDARKSYTIGQFRASALPFQLPVPFKKGVTTSCGI